MGSVIAQLTATSPDSSTPLAYSLTGSTDLAIDGFTGEVSTTTALDHATTPQYSLTVQATDGENTTSVNVSISVLDASTVGNRLLCTMETVQGEILEETQPSVIPLPTCFNSDGSTTSLSDLTSQISSGDPYSLFEATPSGFVSSVSPLDYENRTLHTLTLDLQNSEVPPRLTTLTVIVGVAPVNEFPPVFASNPIRLTTSEAADVGASLGRVEASDMDGGEDGMITYSLVPPSELIFIHSTSGSVILTNSLDYETAEAHNFTVVATDSSEEPTSRRSASAVLTIVVEDANDNPPTLSQAVYSVSIREDSVTGASVAMPTCSDLDVGVNSQITYSIEAGNDDGKFAINAGSGLISLAETLDYDLLSTPKLFALRVQCMDTTPPRATAEALVLVQLTSYNEFTPDPGNERFTTIREDLQPGTRILQVQGSDRDLGPAGTLRSVLQSVTRHLRTYYVHT